MTPSFAEVHSISIVVAASKGAATFLRLPVLAAKLDEVDDSAELRVDFHLSYIDHACLDLLMNWARQHEGTGGKLVVDWSSLRGRFSEDAKVGLARVRDASQTPSHSGPSEPQT